MKNHRLAFIDLETTGLDVYTHEIIEIGCVLVETYTEGNDIKLSVIEEFEYKIAPQNISLANPTALKVNGYKKEDWYDALLIKEVLNILARKTQDAIMVGHNVTFDYMFLDRAFKSQKIQNTMHYHLLDTISIAHAKLHTNEVQKYSLYALCEQFGIKNEHQHTALADARATYELYQKLMEM